MPEKQESSLRQSASWTDHQQSNGRRIAGRIHDFDLGDDDVMYLRLVNPALRQATWAVAGVSTDAGGNVEAYFRQLSPEKGQELCEAERVYQEGESKND